MGSEGPREQKGGQKARGKMEGSWVDFLMAMGGERMEKEGTLLNKYGSGGGGRLRRVLSAEEGTGLGPRIKGHGLTVHSRMGRKERREDEQEEQLHNTEARAIGLKKSKERKELRERQG
jgi:hypothetical protein